MPSKTESRDRTLTRESYNQVLTALFQVAQQQAADTHKPVMMSDLKAKRMARLEQLAEVSLATALKKQSIDVLLRDQMAAVEDR
jgi:hypothetical protein